jgi:hypothetical protein
MQESSMKEILEEAKAEEDSPLKERKVVNLERHLATLTDAKEGKGPMANHGHNHGGGGGGGGHGHSHDGGKTQCGGHGGAQQHGHSHGSQSQQQVGSITLAVDQIITCLAFATKKEEKNNHSLFCIPSFLSLPAWSLTR